ncbi:hypothetical protein [Burkholderia vietnamiensis]|uniref:hypothetical protein n=1 Tax=Burkholderia vietnamiensis TaxID=60552 RepID=UPI000AB71B24|nr:hypothetical protein [Burkholderia vietnamiensis]
MSLYRCESCRCVENTATGFFYGRDDAHWPVEVRGKALCSACGPEMGLDGGKTGFGEWHGRFPRRSAAGMVVDQNGFLWSEGGRLPASVRIVGKIE